MELKETLTVEPQPPFKTHFSALLKFNVFLHVCAPVFRVLTKLWSVFSRSLLSDSLTALEREEEVFVWWQWFIVFLIYCNPFVCYRMTLTS